MKIKCEQDRKPLIYRFSRMILYQYIYFFATSFRFNYQLFSIAYYTNVRVSRVTMHDEKISMHTLAEVCNVSYALCINLFTAKTSADASAESCKHKHSTEQECTIFHVPEPK